MNDNIANPYAITRKIIKKVTKERDTLYDALERLVDIMEAYVNLQEIKGNPVTDGPQLDALRNGRAALDEATS